MVLKRIYSNSCHFFSSPGVFIGSKEININAGVNHNTTRGCEGLLPNHCSSNPCPNYSTCQGEFDSYTCVCPAGYVGKHCVDVCSLKPCRHGRCEKTDTQKGFQCVCPKQYTGERQLRNSYIFLITRGGVGRVLIRIATATAMRRSPDKRFNEQINSCARAL